MKVSFLKLGPIRARLRSFMRIDPVRDWIILVFLSGIALVGIVAVDVWQFNVITDASMQVSTTAPVRNTFNLKEFEAVKALINTRASEQQKYIDGTYTFKDPSK